jgi:hypothetical protein
LNLLIRKGAVMALLDRGPGYTDKKVTDHLLGGKRKLTVKEQEIARAAWMRAYSERKSKQLSGLTIPAAAFGLSTAVASANVVSGLAWLGVFAILAVGGLLTVQLYLRRGIEATEAAAAVHQHRGENL